jgi:uncharacterized membrane protein SirB2
MLAAFYPQIKLVHITCVVLSGSLFTLRGVMMLAGSVRVYHPALKYLSYLIDTTLLTSAVLLTLILHQYPFVQSWLTAKVLLLVVYIALGTFALKRARSRAMQIVCFFAALAVFGFIISIALAHNPWGVFARWLD